MREWVQDLDLNEIKAERVIKAKSKLTSVAINNLADYQIKPK
jgi:hypothetical protein